MISRRRFPTALCLLSLLLGATIPGRAEGTPVIEGVGEITGFEIFQDGASWWRGFGVCGGEFPRDAWIMIANANLAVANPRTLLAGCELLQHPHSNVVRDQSWVYYFYNRSLRRKYIGAPLADEGTPIPAPFTFPVLNAGELGANLELVNNTLYWGSYSPGANRLDVRGMNTDGTEASTFGSINSAGGPVAKLKWLQYRLTVGRFTVTRSALATLLENGRLYRFDVSDGSSTLMATGISDFAVHRVRPLLSTDYTTYVYAAESNAGLNQSPDATPGRLWRIKASVPSDQTLVYQAPAATRRQIVSVTVDPGDSTGFSQRRIYLADAPVDCSGLLCTLGNLAIRRATLPTPDSDPGSWDLIVNNDGGYNLRSDGDWLYYLSNNNTINRIKTDAPAVDFDLAVLNLEITQGLQNMAHSIDLIAGRDGTMVRGYGHVARDNTGTSEVFPDAVLDVTFSSTGERIGGSPFYPVNNASLNGSDVFGALRSDTARSYLFDVGKLPAGLLRFEMTINPNENPAENGSDPYANNTAVRVLEVRNVGEACLVAVPMPTPVGTYDANEHDFADMVRRTETLLPIRRLNLRCWQVLTDGGHVGDILQERFFEDVTVEKDDGQDGDALDAVECLRSSSSDPGGCFRANWAGLIDPDISGFNGLGNRPGCCLIARMAKGSFDDPWNSPLGGRTLAHEMGHNFGRKHVDCGGPKNPDGNYPYESCWFAPDGETSYWGFDPLSLTPIPPSYAGDLMSYRGTRWTSPYTWNAIWNGAFFGGFQAAARVRTVGLAADPGPILFANGTVFLNTSTARLSAFYQVEPGIFDPAKVEAALADSAEAADQPDPFFVRLLDATGDVLSETALPLPVPEDGTEGRVGFSHFMPWTPGTRRVQLVQGDVVWAGRFVSGAAPHVNIPTVDLDAATEEIHAAWSASDADGDPLVFIVQYSPDNGARWETYRFNYPATELTLSTKMFPGGMQARLRVLATDSVLAGVATSQPFAIPDHPPMPLISGVNEGQRVPFGQTLDFYALMLDPEDGRIEGPVVWELDGPTPASREGDSFRLHDLVPGAHAVTAIGTDSANHIGEATRRFLVLPILIGEGDAPSLEGLCNDPGYANATFLRIPDPAGRRVPVRLLHADGDLYASFTGLLRRSGRGAPARVGIRIDVDGADDAIASADRGFFIDENGIPGVEVGGNQGLSPSDTPPSGFQAASHLTEGGWCAELKIPDTALGGWNHRVRLMFLVGSSAWPETADADHPATWAETWLGTELPAPGPNRPPIADAGAAQVVNVFTPRRVVLNGRNSHDPDGDALSYSWSQTAGPDVEIEGAGTAMPAFTAEPPADGTEEYRFALVVNDGAVDSAPAETTVRTHRLVRLTTTAEPGGVVTEEGFQGHLLGTPGRRYEVQASTDFDSWLTLMSNVADYRGLIDFIDADFGRFEYRFYRAVEVAAP